MIGVDELERSGDESGGDVKPDATCTVRLEQLSSALSARHVRSSQLLTCSTSTLLVLSLAVSLRKRIYANQRRRSEADIL